MGIRCLIRDELSLSRWCYIFYLLNCQEFETRTLSTLLSMIHSENKLDLSFFIPYRIYHRMIFNCENLTSCRIVVACIDNHPKAFENPSNLKEFESEFANSGPKYQSFFSVLCGILTNLPHFRVNKISLSSLNVSFKGLHHHFSHRKSFSTIAPRVSANWKIG